MSNRRALTFRVSSCCAIRWRAIFGQDRESEGVAVLRYDIVGVPDCEDQTQ